MPASAVTPFSVRSLPNVMVSLPPQPPRMRRVSPGLALSMAAWRSSPASAVDGALVGPEGHDVADGASPRVAGDDAQLVVGLGAQAVDDLAVVGVPAARLLRAEAPVDRPREAVLGPRGTLLVEAEAHDGAVVRGDDVDVADDRGWRGLAGHEAQRVDGHRAAAAGRVAGAGREAHRHLGAERVRPERAPGAPGGGLVDGPGDPADGGADEVAGRAGRGVAGGDAWPPRGRTRIGAASRARCRRPPCARAPRPSSSGGPRSRRCRRASRGRGC